MVLPFSRTLLLSTSVAALYASGLTDYAVGSNEPEFVADFAGVLNSGTEYYRSGGSDTTFSSVFTHTKGDDKPFTMTDSDGVLKWAPHNLFQMSQEFDNAYWSKTNGTVTANATTAPDGSATADEIVANVNFTPTLSRTSVYESNITVRVWAKAGSGGGDFLVIRGFDFTTNGAVWFDLVNGTKGTETTYTGSISSAGNGWHLCTVIANIGTDTNGRFFFYSSDTNGAYTATTGDSIFLWGAHAYRSDLGGMVNNPDRGDSYVPTTTAAKFLPRRNHYLYNGSTYDNAGILIEPADATNLLLASNDFDNAGYSLVNATITEGQTNSITGASDATLLAHSAAFGSCLITENLASVAVSTAHTISVYAKAGGASWIRIGTRFATTPADGGVYFNLSTGAKGTETSGFSGQIENVGGGWYRCSATFTTNASDGNINVDIVLAEGDNDISWASSTASDNVYLFGWQVEVGSVPTSYIPTSGSTVTRAAETLTIGASIVPDTPTALCAQVSGYQTYDSSGFDVVNLCGTSVVFGDAFMIRFGNSAGDSLANFYGGQTATQTVWEPVAGGINRGFNFAARHSASEIQIASGGTAGATANPTNMSTFTGNSFVFRTTANSKYGGTTLSMLRWWEADIGEAGIEEAST